MTIDVTTIPTPITTGNTCKTQTNLQVHIFKSKFKQAKCLSTKLTLFKVSKKKTKRKGINLN